MKNVLMLAHDDSGQEARLQAALDLTRALGGHLHCVDAVQVPVMVDNFGGAATTVLLYDGRQREAENRRAVEGRLAREDVSWSCTEAIGDFSRCIEEAARTADLVVLNRQLDRTGPDMRRIATDVLTHTRALVVAVDDDLRGFDAAGRAMIAWDGSETAMATIKRAIPLLRLASEVRIFQAGPLSEAAIPADEAAAYLSRHGIRADVEIARRPDSIAVAIRMAAERSGAAYLVMGAFKHGVLKEALLGGVARAMLSACNLPLVLGH
ncbi:universal stress protein [Sphingomonas sp.]|jgi:nucleotide-binding universal stress UspA family protein|uniref:universal stress protein n=1 Tax=Sphingomonas sp. TaxID=28214 RepID=UPI002DE9BA35|nr:universal stress protein [Sphingomonas sp.]